MALTKITSRILDSSGVTILGTIATGVWAATDIAVLHGGTGASTAGAARTNLGLVIGTHVLAQRTFNDSNWDTAFGWGNHTGGGYVKTTTDQTIAGVKTFSGEVIINPSTNRKISFKDNNNAFKAGIQAVNTAGQMAGTSEVDELIIRSQLGMRFATGGNTERFRITSSGAATFSGNVTSSGLIVNTGNGAGKKIYLNGNTSRRNWMIAAQQNVDDAFEITRSTANGGSTYNSPSFLIQGSTGNVGIGTTSPTAILDVRRGDASGKIAEFHTSTGYGLEFGSSQAQAYINSGSSQSLAIGTNNSTKLTISSGGDATFSGGATFSSWNTLGNIRLSSNPTGIEFYNTSGIVRNWQVSAQSINSQSLDFTPSTATGGTTYSSPVLSLHGITNAATFSGLISIAGGLGKISAPSANDLAIYGTAAGHNGIRFHDVGLLPTNNAGLIIDNDCDIGIGTHRFKNLYLSSGVYFGGSGDASYLDDYEEGVFSPVYSSDNGTVITNLTAQTGNYVKVGKLVHISGSLRTQGSSSTSGVTGNLNISGLPFNSNAVRGHVTFWTHETAAAYNAPAQLPRASPVQSGAAKINIYKYSGSGGRTIRYLVSDLNMSGNSNFMHFSGTYEVN